FIWERITERICWESRGRAGKGQNQTRACICTSPKSSSSDEFAFRNVRSGGEEEEQKRRVGSPSDHSLRYCSGGSSSVGARLAGSGFQGGLRRDDRVALGNAGDRECLIDNGLRVLFFDQGRRDVQNERYKRVQLKR